ncbi:MAG: hypothetical protein CSA86_01450 [Arcobacter sp.]|nr:MAG: hypothetical protein CSA86_01450 [Arcobacter sp.]
MRLLFSFILAGFVSLFIFIGMERMTNTKNIKHLKKEDIPRLVYLRDAKDTQVNKKKRIQPKKPDVQKIQKINLKQPKIKMNIQKSVQIQPIMTENIDLPTIASLDGGGAKMNVEIGLIDANTLMTLSKIYPTYPRRARVQKKEGFVQLHFQIDINGYIHNPKVVKSNPKGVFEKSALRAIKRWRFRPMKNSDKNTLVDATITFNYRLAK